MLRRTLPGAENSGPLPPPPIRRLAPLSSPYAAAPLRHDPDAQFVTSEPRVAGHGISQSAFTPNYFKSFFGEERELGRGGKGVVLLVTHKIDGVRLGQFACKRVPVGDDHAWLEKVLIEVQTLQNLSHPNLVSYRHVWLEDFQISKFGPSVPCAFILQQYCNGGDLHHYVLGPSKNTDTAQALKDRMRRRSKGQMEEPVGLSGSRRMHFDEIYTFFKDIASGLHHLHSNNFIHRDIKPSNCLLNNVGGRIRVLLSDFGEVQATTAARKGTGATGTVSYCAPEVLRRDRPVGVFGNFTVKSDIFSLGMIVYFMCFGALPYSQATDINEENEDADLLREEIVAWAGLKDDGRRGRSDLPDQLYAFLKRLLAVNPEDRPSTEDILRDIQDPDDLVHDNFLPHSILDDGRNPRISVADSPSLHPRRQFQRNASSSSAQPGVIPSQTLIPPPSKPQFQGPGHTSPTRKSPLSQSERQRSMSPTKPAPMTSIIRARKRPGSSGEVDAEPGLEDFQRPSSPRLAILPPPHPLHEMLPFLVQVAKISLFLVKYLSLASPCRPMSARPSVAIPLLLLAACDFILAGPVSWSLVSRSSVVLLVTHAVLVSVAARYGVLCESFV
jgi:serine/threonine protein kinase